MKKLLLIAVLCGLIVSACGRPGNAVAAVVDGQEITVADVEALISSEGEAVSKEQFAQFLSFHIQWNVIMNAAEVDYGLTYSDDEVTAEADSIADEFITEGQTREEFLAERGITEEFLRNIAAQGLLEVDVREELADEVDDPTAEEIDGARDLARADLTNACVSHILVADEDAANDAFDRVQDGEDFGEVAEELSEDTGSAANQGVLPCAAPSGYVEPFRDAVLDATVGEIYPELVQSQFGYHIILVTDREDPATEDLPSDDELADGLRANSVTAALEEWFLGAMAEADVTVEEEYGTWQANPPSVVPPVGE